MTLSVALHVSYSISTWSKVEVKDTDLNATYLYLPSADS